MTPQEAREIILTEWECVDRQDTPKCDRDCRHCDLVMDTELVREAYRMATKALEIVNDFETARIITGGRLNGRTYAYKCGLADGQRLAKGEKLFNILPSVTPKQKTGKWKLLSCTYGHGCVYTCSECGETEFYVSNYCPNCRAKMEVEE